MAAPIQYNPPSQQSCVHEKNDTVTVVAVSADGSSQRVQVSINGLGVHIINALGAYWRNTKLTYCGLIIYPLDHLKDHFRQLRSVQIKVSLLCNAAEMISPKTFQIAIKDRLITKEQSQAYQQQRLYGEEKNRIYQILSRVELLALRKI